jgi:hypothetical protein
MIYLNCYHMSRCFGGPEEGGWYYDRWHSGTNLGTFKTREEATAFRDSDQCQQILKGEQPVYQMGAHSMDGCDPEGNGDDVYLQRGGAWGQDEMGCRLENHPPKSGDNYHPYC